MFIYFKNLKISLEVITGFLVGVEFIPDYNVAMVDLFVFRIMVDWSGEKYI
jgi:hypothetical protein